MDIQWERATEEVKSFYGKDYFYRFFLKDNRENSAESPDKVIEAVVDALLNETPRARYLVPGSSRLVDIDAVSLDIHAMHGSTNQCRWKGGGGGVSGFIRMHASL